MSDKKPMRTIAISDIHGCSHALRTLISAIEPQPDDLVIPLGDLIDRGPDAREVIDLLLDLRGRCRLMPLMGNHEEMMLAVLDGAPPQRWIQAGGAATLDSYRFTGSLDVVPADQVDFLRACSNYVELDTHFFVHANYDPKLPLAQQSTRTVRWASLEEHVPDPHVSGKVAVVGHTAHRDGQVFSLRHLMGIDTYCYGGAWLTACEVGSGRIWQANQDGKLRSTGPAPTRKGGLAA